MRRHRLLGLLLACCTVLAGCAGPPREDICRRILEAVLPANAEPKVVAVEPDPLSRHGVVLRYTTRPTGLRQPMEHHLLCAFAPTGDAEHYGLVSVEIDGKPLSAVKLVLLHRWLRQPVPGALLQAPAAPRWPLSLHLAYLAQQVLNGLVTGAMIALIAAGYTLIYGVARHMQLALSEALAIGGFALGLTYVATSMLGAGAAAALGLGLPIVVALGALGGATMHRLVFRHLRGARTQTVLIAAIGLAMFLQEFLRLSQGGRAQWMPSLLPGEAVLFSANGFDVTVTHAQIAIPLLALALCAALARVLASTRAGRLYRASADDPRMAALLGVDVGRVVAVTYAAGAALASLAGAGMILQYGVAGAEMGTMIGFKALTAALVGGIGSFPGALAGGLAIGLVDALWAGYLDGTWRDAAIFAILVLVLIFRPAGLFEPNEPLTSGDLYGASGSAPR